MWTCLQDTCLSSTLALAIFNKIDILAPLKSCGGSLLAPVKKIDLPLYLREWFYFHDLSPVF